VWGFRRVKAHARKEGKITNKIWHAALKTLELLATREAALPISAWLDLVAANAKWR